MPRPARYWWTAADATAFKARSERLARQFDGYDALPGLFISGQLTLGENIADYLGLWVAVDVYRLSLRGRTPPVIDGLSGEQRLFLGYAQASRSKSR